MSVPAMSLLRGSRRCVRDAEMARWVDDFGRGSDLNKTFNNDSRNWSGRGGREKEENKKKFWILEFKEFAKSSGFAKSKRTCRIQKDLQNSKKFAKSKKICRIRKDLQNPKGLAEFKRICGIQKNLWNPKGFAESKRICRKLFVYKLILLFTKERANRR